jgi:hypothetical protein
VNDPRALRSAILAAPLETSSDGAEPKLGTLYVPPAHVKALRLESSLVIGGRGVGKSFWAAALKTPGLRQLLGAVVPDLDRAEVHIGFSEQGRIEHYPDEATFKELLRQGIDPYDIWRAVVLSWLGQRAGAALPGKWPELICWMLTHTEDAARLIESSRQSFAAASCGLIVFDALDRTSNDWRSMDAIVRGLLRTVLWLRSYPWLRAKVFLRSDQSERTVTDFPDASKLLATRAELGWALHDLHGMLWQRLINASDEHGQALRDLYRSVIGNEPVERGGAFDLPESLKRESSATQRALFEALAGPWMGNDKRRGVPYTWSVGHLADSRGQSSPRSFLAAIQQATEDSQERYDDYPLALHYESIKRGIQKASEIRVAEIAEDYRWVRTFLEGKLRGLNVPCEFELIVERWQQAFPGGPSSAPTDGLPPQHIERGWEGIRDDLIRLGVLEQKKDGRIDMPDLYRVGFLLGRRGGVKPKN